jgi:hypothetical protein
MPKMINGYFLIIGCFPLCLELFLFKTVVPLFSLRAIMQIISLCATIGSGWRVLQIVPFTEKRRVVSYIGNIAYCLQGFSLF